MSEKEKVEKITSWKQLKERSRIGKVTLKDPTNGKLFELEVQGLSQSIIDNINEKYEAMKPQEITDISKDDRGNKIVIKVTSGPDYDEYQKKVKDIEINRMAELALAFLVVKPEGILSEQIKQLREDLIAGHFVDIIKAGYEMSGFNIDQRVEQGKNS